MPKQTKHPSLAAIVRALQDDPTGVKLDVICSMFNLRPDYKPGYFLPSNEKENAK